MAEGPDTGGDAVACFHALDARSAEELLDRAKAAQSSIDAVPGLRAEPSVAGRAGSQPQSVAQIDRAQPTAPAPVPAADPNFHRLDALLSIVERARPDCHARRHHGTHRWEYRRESGAITEEMLRAHLNGGPHLGMYLITAGADTTRLAALDLDDHGGILGWSRVRDTANALAARAEERQLRAWAVLSGGGLGIHLFFFWNEAQPAAAVRALLGKLLAEADLKSGTRGLANGEVEIFPKQDRLDREGDGSYGSVIALPFGRKSVPLDENLNPCNEPRLMFIGADLGALSMPEQLVARRSMGARRQADLSVVRDAIQHLPSDDYDTWLRVGMALKLDVGEAGFALWNDWSATSTKYGGELDLRRKWKSFRRDGEDRAVITLDNVFARARDAGWTRGSDIAPAFSDEDLATSFAEEHRADLRFTDKWGRWNCWDGTRWRPDDTLSALDLARSHCRAAAARANKGQKSIASHRASAATLSLARADRRLAMRVEQWDSDPWLLATPGGAVDLRTGQLRAADPIDYLTRCTAVAPGGSCPRWLQTLNEVLGDADRIAFLQRWFGYGLTGSVREEKLLFLHGSGRNGKGTLVETIAWVMGDHAAVVPTTALMQTKHLQHPTEIAKLCGVRLAIGAEVQQGARWNVEEIKKLTGGDKLTARFMCEDFFDFNPTHKLTVSGNALPALGHVDQAIAARMLLLEFRMSFAGHEDLTLKEALRAESGGILSWLIEGCREWQRQGLAIPDSVKADTANYLRTRDDLAMWLDECCVREDDPTGRKTDTGELLRSYQAWREQNGGDWISAADFTNRLRAMGFAVDEKRSHGRRCVSGVRLISVTEAVERLERESEGALPFC